MAMTAANPTFGNDRFGRSSASKTSPSGGGSSRGHQRPFATGGRFSIGTARGIRETLHAQARGESRSFRSIGARDNRRAPIDGKPPRRHCCGPMARMTKQQAAEFYRRLAAADPAPQTELAYVNAFTLLVAVVLSAQATDVGVNRATAKLFRIASTPEAMIALGEAALGDHIRTIGLWRAKAKNVIALSHVLLEHHGGAVPGARAALEALPGVGRKTANVVANVLFGEKTIAVDTHVFRVGNRSGLGPGKTPRAVEDALMKSTPSEFLDHAHHWLILHGRYVCKARAPECWRCAVADLCAFRKKTPAPAARAAKRKSAA
jgi:endonuclease-3